MVAVPGALVETLPPEAASVGRARRLVAEVVTGSGRADLVDSATLLVSEVVTNSVLHAGTEIRLMCGPSPNGVRVEVFDGSPLLPGVRHYDADATTGRGLALVSAVADAWGITREEEGKTVWFELGRPEGTDGDARSTVAVVDPAPMDEGLVVRLRGASPRLVRATIEHGDALLRELALLALGGELEDALPQGWQLPQFDVSPILDAVEAAAAERRPKADLDLRLAPAAVSAASERLRLVDHADALAREGRLLSAPALPEVAVCRHWLYSQITEQAAGVTSRAWEMPAQLEPNRVAAVLAAEEVDQLRRATAATVVADDANRIVFVNDAAGELLGWAPEALVGQRLTVLIPPELREAHLAGFSRLQVTGEAQILGRTVRVPALRRDGLRVHVALLIEQLAGEGGRRAFRASLRPVGEGEPVTSGVDRFGTSVYQCTSD